MLTELLLMVSAVLAVGVIGGTLTLRIAKYSVAWAAILGPLTIVCSMAAGLIAGLHLMLIEDTGLVLIIIGATMPVAIVIGIIISVRSTYVASQAREEIERERRRHEVEQGRRELITWLSHDLRTPLAGIQAMGEAIEDGVAQDPKRYIHMMISEAKRTADMVNDLLSLADLHNDTVSAQSEELSLTDVTSDMVSQLTPLAQSADIHVDFAPSSDHITVQGSPSLLSRGIQNIIANAIEYSQKHSHITVTVSRVEQYAMVSVRDQCGGLSADAIEHMCDVGWRGSSARTPSGHSGSGLGLPIVQMIARAHGGDVHIKSVPGGCCVTITMLAA